MTTNSMAKRVALAMWRKDGEPEAVAGDPTSVGRSWYEDRAREVLEAAEGLGYGLVKKKSNAKPHAASAAAG